MPAATKAAAKLASLAVAAAAAAGGFAWWQSRADESQQLIAEQARTIEYLRNVAGRLTLERRAAQIVVTGQRRDDDGRLVTDLLFFEVGPDGDALPPRPFAVVGERVHVGALVIKFQNDLVAEGDPLRGHSIALWDTIHGSAVAPEEGEPIDPPGAAPRVYRDPDPSQAGLDADRRAFEAGLWRDFWKLARDRDYAKAKGVRVAQGEQVFGVFEPGRVYELTLESDGGLSLYARDLDPVVRALLGAVGVGGGDGGGGKEDEGPE